LQLEERNRILAQAMRELDEERELSEQLLLNVLPHSIAERLKREKGLVADRISEVTVLFADIVGFTPVSSRLAPEGVVAWLDYVVSSLDRLAKQHRMERIKTIGDCYMMVSGLPTPRPRRSRCRTGADAARRDGKPRDAT
jgi:class 3 adenylate cyclase